MNRSNPKAWAVVTVASAIAWSCEPAATPEEGEPAVGTRGMVSTAHPLATDAGLTVLQQGGNAFDAAVAIAAALNVVEPMMSGIGGYGTILTYSADEGRVRFLNPSGRIPAGTDSDAYRAPTPDYRENRRGAKAVSTPGNVNAWRAMSEEYGVLQWARLFDEAVRLAEEGFVISDRTAGMIARAYESFPAHAQTFFGVNGRPLEQGERLVQRDLGSSLRLIADQGAEAVHGGALGRAIDAAMRQADGFLRLQDLIDNEAEWWDPIAVEYRGYEVVTASPPANSFPALVRLGMMSRYDLASLGHNSVDYLHRFAEVTKHGFWTRLMYAGDPDHRPPPLRLLLGEEYWAEQVENIDPDTASVFVPPTQFSDGDGNTTHFVVADRWGNIVTATQTLGNAFGSRIMPEGTGIWLNNSLAYSTFEPKGNPMDAHAGRRKLSGDVPVIVLRDGRPWIAIGTPGGHTIGQTVPQMLMNMIDFGMNVQEALDAGRISFVEPDVLAVEERILQEIREALAARGHNVRSRGSLGNAHALIIEYDESGRPVRFAGAADSRGQGVARGY
jgi:gamma-glutamyltranspeptidase/glutathione hydrolase